MSIRLTSLLAGLRSSFSPASHSLLTSTNPCAHQQIKMKLSVVVPLAAVALLPLAHAILLLETGTAAATSSTIGITLGSSAAASLGAAALVVGALVVGGVVLAGAGHHIKRDVSNFCLPTSSPELFLELAANSDRAGCGLRLVCELEATPDEVLSTDELLILNLFG